MIKKCRIFLKKMRPKVVPSFKSISSIEPKRTSKANIIKNAQPHNIAESEEIDYRKKHILNHTKIAEQTKNI